MTARRRRRRRRRRSGEKKEKSKRKCSQYFLVVEADGFPLWFGDLVPGQSTQLVPVRLCSRAQHSVETEKLFASSHPSSQGPGNS
jgi:hypothetical protein